MNEYHCDLTKINRKISDTQTTNFIHETQKKRNNFNHWKAKYLMNECKNSWITHQWMRNLINIIMNEKIWFIKKSYEDPYPKKEDTTEKIYSNRNNLRKLYSQTEGQERFTNHKSFQRRKSVFPF